MAPFMAGVCVSTAAAGARGGIQGEAWTLPTPLWLSPGGAMALWVY